MAEEWSNHLRHLSVLFREGSDFMGEFLKLCDKHRSHIRNITYVPNPRLLDREADAEPSDRDAAKSLD